MKDTVQIDEAGRLVLPKDLRDRFQLRGGDSLAVQVRGDAIELRPTHASGHLKRVNGVLVYTGPGRIEIGEDLVARAREARIASLARPFKERR